MIIISNSPKKLSQVANSGPEARRKNKKNLQLSTWKIQENLMYPYPKQDRMLVS